MRLAIRPPTASPAREPTAAPAIAPMKPPMPFAASDSPPACACTSRGSAWVVNACSERNSSASGPSAAFTMPSTVEISAALIATVVQVAAIGEEAPKDGITPAQAIAAMIPVTPATTSITFAARSRIAMIPSIVLAAVS